MKVESVLISLKVKMVGVCKFCLNRNDVIVIYIKFVLGLFSIMKRLNC